VSVEDAVEEEEEVEEVEVEPMAGMKLDRKAREVLMSMADKKPNPPNTPSRVGSTLAQYSSAATTTRWQTTINKFNKVNKWWVVPEPWYQGLPSSAAVASSPCPPSDALARFRERHRASSLA
jgi:hypothetical protein